MPDGDGASVACTVELNGRVDADDLILRLAVLGNEPSAANAVRRDSHRHDLPPRVDVEARTGQDLVAGVANLYTLVATLERGATVIDRISSSFGVRTIVARGRQLLLNGRPLKIKGVNRYDEFGGFGPNPAA